VTAAPDEVEVLESVPQRAPAQPAPESFQVTPLLCGSFCTVAMKLWERLTGTVCTTGPDGDGHLRRAGDNSDVRASEGFRIGNGCGSQCGCWRIGDLRRCRVDDRDAGWTAGAGYGSARVGFAIGAGNTPSYTLVLRIVLDSSSEILSLINRECWASGETLTTMGAGETAMTMAADADLAASAIEVAVRRIEADAASCEGAV